MTKSIATALAVFLCVTATGCDQAPKPAEVTEPARQQVARIVFIGQKEACDCTRARIDASWQALEAANTRSPQVPIERIQSDTEPEAAQRYTSMKALMVVPGIYFLDDQDTLIELLQGEVTRDKIADLLH